MSIKVVRQPKAGTAKVTFSLPADFPEGPVSVVGSFNDWTPGVHPLKKRGDTRSVSVVVPLGEPVRFRYLGTGGAWFDDADAEPSPEGSRIEL